MLKCICLLDSAVCRVSGSVAKRPSARLGAVTRGAFAKSKYEQPSQGVVDLGAGVYGSESSRLPATPRTTVTATAINAACTTTYPVPAGIGALMYAARLVLRCDAWRVRQLISWHGRLLTQRDMEPSRVSMP